MRLLAILFAVAFFVTGPASAAPKVVVGIKPIHSLVAGIMKGVAEPELIVGGNAVPYGYELTETQEKNLAQADLIIWLGPEIEPFLAAPVARRGSSLANYELLASDMFKILPVLGGTEDSRDPFFWLDVRNARVLVDELAREIVAVDPDNAARYLKNRRDLMVEVTRIDREFEYGYRAVAAGPMVLYHGTQQYFAQAYALDVAAILSPAPDRPATAAALLGAIATAKTAGAQCLLTERGLAAQGADMPAGGAGLRIAELDSLGTAFEPGPGLYTAMMQHNFDVMSACAKAAAGQQ